MRFPSFLLTALAAGVLVPMTFAQANPADATGDRSASYWRPANNQQSLSHVEPRNQCGAKFTEEEKADEVAKPMTLAVSLFNSGRFAESRCVVEAMVPGRDASAKNLLQVYRARHIGEPGSVYVERVGRSDSDGFYRATPSLMLVANYSGAAGGGVYILHAPGTVDDATSIPKYTATAPVQPARVPEVSRPDQSDALVLGSLAAIMALVILGGNDSADSSSGSEMHVPANHWNCDGGGCRSVPYNYQAPPPPGGGP